jgi:formylglycine-generating enzyme required for sulfatase activity
MIWIPEGKFIYGNEKRTAHVAGFSLGRFPITNEQFAAFLAETKYTPPADHPDNDWFLAHWKNGKPARGFEQHPVIWVSLIDALAYARWSGGTLPTEWLWEKAELIRGVIPRCGPTAKARKHAKSASSRT